MRIDHTYTLREPITGAVLFEMDAILECSLEWEGGEPRLSVDAVLVEEGDEEINLAHSPDYIVTTLAARIAVEAEDDDRIFDALLEAEGVVYCGQGGNDPDGLYRRAS